MCLISRCLAVWSRGSSDQSIAEADIASSLLYLITDQMTQTVYLVAKCQGVSTAIFCGSFLGHNLSIIAQIKSKLEAASVYLNVSAVHHSRESFSLLFELSSSVRLLSLLNQLESPQTGYYLSLPTFESVRHSVSIPSFVHVHYARVCDTVCVCVCGVSAHRVPSVPAA